MAVGTAADLISASANAASLLHVTARQRKAPPPDPALIDAVRESAMQVILTSPPKG
jgi:hypothetical protein